MTAPGNHTLDRARAVSMPASLGRWLMHPLPWLGLALLALPFFVSVIGMTDVAATKLAIFFLIAIGFNVLLGYTGLVSFGHSIFFGFGAYATALLQIHVFKGGVWLPRPRSAPGTGPRRHDAPALRRQALDEAERDAQNHQDR